MFPRLVATYPLCYGCALPREEWLPGCEIILPGDHYPEMDRCWVQYPAIPAYLTAIVSTYSPFEHPGFQFAKSEATNCPKLGDFERSITGGPTPEPALWVPRVAEGRSLSTRGHFSQLGFVLGNCQSRMNTDHPLCTVHTYGTSCLTSVCREEFRSTSAPS
jgi:hypothetical protein